MLKGFKDFLLRGNVMDLAIGIVVGGAFTAVVTGMVDGILNPLIAAIFGQPDISSVGHFTVNGAHFSLGLVLNALLNFLIISAALYFLIMVPINTLIDLGKKKLEPETEEEMMAQDIALLTEIRDLLKSRDAASDATVSQADEEATPVEELEHSGE
ncbi:MAG: large conductance mechanosensitive channel protein MscL [Cellulomonadaceae bacterium]|jgi:large conductance mechanosensitive channel|nr:large conductance mechanosensitive channel protein MscL [Cellulomonadaceae bacterium]